MAAHAGINIWAAGIRYRMTNDPGRQDLDDHILCNGFLFLDEYLEDIILGGRTEPIIELTKTPGRRKDMSKKDRIATAANGEVHHLQVSDKENIPALKSPTFITKAPTSFQKALLKASRENQQPDVESIPTHTANLSGNVPKNHFGTAVVCKGNDEEQEEEAVEVLVTPPSTRTVPAIKVKGISPPLNIYSASGTSPDLDPSSASPPPRVDASPCIDLSVIAESDEGEASQISMPTSRPAGPIISHKEISYHIPTDPNNPDGPMATVTVSYNPTEEDDDIQVFPATFDRTFNDSEPTSTASSFPTDPYARDYETHELAQVVAEHESTNKRTPPHSPLASLLTRKTSVPVFPSLPALSPPRKSTLEPLVAGQMTANGLSSTVTGSIAGTRSSWLNKARDVTATRASIVSGVKRKSGDLVGESDHTFTGDDYPRPTKAAKTNVGGGSSNAVYEMEKPHVRLPIQPFRAIVPAKVGEQHREVSMARVAHTEGNSEGMMYMLKRTVEGLGARVGKSMGKSLGGAAATAAAAEAKAAAEARLAQREAKGSDESRQGRLCLSDLVEAYESGGSDQGREDPLDFNLKFILPPPAHVLPGSKISTSTTPPDSPPALWPTVFQAPPSAERPANTIPKFQVHRSVQQEASFGLPESQPSTQSTYVSSVFDDHSAWPRSSLGTEYTASQSLSQPKTHLQDFMPTHDDGASGLFKEADWVENNAKFTTPREELPTLVTGHDLCSIPRQSCVSEDAVNQVNVPGALKSKDLKPDINILHDDDMDSEELNNEPTLDAAEAKYQASPSQDKPTTSQGGFVAQASTLLSKVMGSSVSALGGSKRGKPEPVKSIQLAAAAARKQQEEADRKAARLKEMDKRRAAIASKKADQDATDRSRQQGDRPKREREEGLEKNATRTTVKKVEEEVTKKRKVIVEIEKKPQGKKPLSKDKKELGNSRIGKPALHSSQSQLQLLSTSTSKSFKQPGLPASASQPSITLVGSSQCEPRSVSSSLVKAGSSNTKDKVTSGLEDVRQPSQALHAQMQARVQAQMLQAMQDEPLIPSESIELPDINSEYSNSDDEDRPRTFDPPDWAQSPVLGQALQLQSRLNPDDIFGPVRPLRMEEIFTTRHSRFRARTSSANWAGTDELTMDEERTYAKKMGYLD